MKKFCFLFTVLFIGLFAQGQTYLFQGFGSGYWPPAGWTPLPLGSQWSLSPTDNAGGILPEARFEGFDYNGTVRLISPLIDMTDADTVILSFRYFPEVDTIDLPQFGVSTRSGSGTWNNVWETTMKNSNEPREFEVLITDENLGNPDFQFSFFLNGDMNRLFNFYLDNIKLYYPTGTDGKLDEILTPAHVELPEPVVATVVNLGITTISEVGVTWLTNMGVKHDSLFTGLDMKMYDRFTFQFDRWWVSPFGDYDLKMWISSVNGEEDPYHPNDTLIKRINFSIPPRPWRLPCLETFTACWCQPCATWADVYDPWCEDHPDAVVIKYQIGSDPYATPEGHFRIEYYDLNAIPYTYCNGILVANVDTNDLDTAYYPACLLHSDFIINSSFSVNDKVITVNNNIFPYVTTYGARVQTVVMEKTTYGNVGGNGQFQFHNVEMKMFPESGEGEVVDFCNDLPYTKTYTANLDSTNIEEFDDLLVAVFIQQDSSKEILQSAYSIEDGDFSSEDRLSMITLDGQPLEGFDPDVFSYDVELPIFTIESPVVLGIPMHDSAMMAIKQAFEVPGSAVIDVYPESLGTLKRYIVSFGIATNIDDQEIPVISAFPNPVNVNGKIFLTGVKDFSAKLYTLDGKLLLNIKNNNDNTIDLSGVKPGFYILDLVSEEGYLIVKKIIVM